MTAGIVVSRADSASVAIGEGLRTVADWEERTDDSRADGEGGGRYHVREDFELREFDELHLHLDRVADAFDDPDAIVFVSRHAGETGPLLSAHFTGNLGPADHGGRPDEFAQAAPGLLPTALVALERHAPDGYDVGMECTHHGPTEVSAPSMFVELGSGEDEWSDPEGARAVARAVLDLCGVDAHGDRALVAFGGGHYAPRPTRIIEQTDWGVGHVAADWSLDDLGDPEAHQEVVARMFEASGAEHAVVDGDKPAVERVVADLGYRVVSETWVRETDGVPLDLADSLEDDVQTVGDGLRFGEAAVGYDGGYAVVDLPAELLDAAHATDPEATVDAARETALAYATDENGNRLAGPAAFSDDDAYDAFLDRAVDVLERDYDVDRQNGSLTAARETFDPAAASELGVPEGPKFGRLAAGESVDVDGTEVEPGDVTRTESTTVSVGFRERARERVRRPSDAEGKGN